MKAPRVRSVFYILLLSTCATAQSTTTAKWLDISQADLMTRYRYIDDSAGQVTADDLQYRFTGRVKVGVPMWGTSWARA